MRLEVDIEKNTADFRLRASLSSEGGIVGLLGASGSGKSMLLRCIAGIDTPDRGSIVLDDRILFNSEKHINLPPQKRQVGYLFQNYALFPNMSVKKNILCGLNEVKDKSKQEELVSEALKLFRLEDIAEHRPSQISGGQAQRTALARILVNKPRLLMLDEPFSALDSHMRLRLQIELKTLLSDYEGGVLLVTHDRDEAYHMCDTITIADNGAFSQIRETKLLFADPGTFSAARITGCKNIALAEKLGDYEVRVPEWNVCFKTAQRIRDGLKGVAFRAHYLNMKTSENRYPVVLEREMEEPFEWILLFRYKGQSTESQPIWWRLPNDKRPQVFPKELGIAPANILLLYE